MKVKVIHFFWLVVAAIGIVLMITSVSMGANYVSAEEILYVGDEIRDIKACKKVKIDVLSVTWGIGDKELLRITSPKYIVDILQKYWIY